MEEYYTLVLKKAVELSRDIGGKALVLIYPPKEDLEIDYDGPVVIVGEEFDVKGERIKKLPLPLSLGLNNLVNLVAAFLKGQGIISSGDVFVYITEDLIGIKKVKGHLLAAEDLFDRYEGIIQRVLEIAIELSVEGREGRPVGTIFVVGDTKNVLKHSHQLVPNPFKGHNLNILDPKVKGVVKEFSAIDGAFVISSRGRLVAAGRYLDVDPKRLDVKVPPGLGSRHLASAAITKITKAVAITLSETGAVRIFKDGELVLEYNPRIKY
ncbi:hypothetical protein PYCH_09400 [Pyrococcus yayanosii CH1]|uniref:Diadenylate cyclase n=1 Tax=Pyrococcus yayanosii (strain CH1 / JCM 16557) TaxID=529709 RepID=F8AJ39_PYRYC|nr:hypothetical protein PYCH_09400 [Pyrococcus yayanosii CH1]